MKIHHKVIGCLCSTLLLFAPLASAAPSMPLKFDFGTADSPVFPGFSGVSDKTIYSPESTFGFVGTAPTAYNRIRPNILAGDFILSKAKSAFRVDLPNGQYKAWFIYGDSRYAQRVFTTVAKKRSITINGKPAVSDPLSGWKEFYSEKYFFRGYRDIYHADDDFYSKYVAPEFTQATVSFDVTNGQAVFHFEDIPLNAMLIYAAEDTDKMESDVAYLNKELRRYTIIREVKPENLNPDISYSAADKKRGYVTYSRFATNPPQAYDRPLAGEIDATPGAFVARGQKATLSLTVLPLQELTNVKVTHSSLTDKTSGTTIAANAVKMEYVAHHEVAQKGSHRNASAAYVYQVEPLFIKPQPANFERMDQGINRTFLLTVTADTNTKAGVYEGTVTIAPQNAPSRQVPIRVRVLPVTLPELPILAGRYAMDHDFYYYYYWSKTFTEDDFRDFVWARQKMRMQWAEEMGLNSIAFSDDLRADISAQQLNPDGRMIRFMDLYRDMGFKAMPWYGFQALSRSEHNMQGLGTTRFSPEWTANYKQLIENIRDTGKARNWPEIIFYLSDELSNHGAEGTADGLKRAAVTADIDGIRRISSVNGKYEHPLIGKLEMLMPNFAFPITQGIIDEMKAQNTELWLYNVGDFRYTWGYYIFRTGAKGRYQWYNNSGMGFPFNDFDSSYGDSVYSAFVAGPDGPISQVYALDMRDGLDDLRYLTLLKTLLDDAKNSQSKAVQDGKMILAEIAALDADLRNAARSNIDAQAAGFDAGAKIWSPETCERMRWRVAQCILELQKEGI